MGIKAIPGAIGRAFAVTPGTPADRVAMLREAFAKALNDPELMAEGKKQRSISPSSLTSRFKKISTG